MLQGTGSDVGKSMLVAGLCRLFTQAGLRVRPFKPQNMSNNAAVTCDGGEIGRAQALQALACGVTPSVDMNPVLLKPEAETGSQVIVQGKRIGSFRARDYFNLKADLMPRVLESFDAIGQNADLIVAEGAGSAAEINLRAGDIANMGFALAANVPVFLVADIDRGGVIANLIGTHAILANKERNQVRGFAINKFRGDVSLFDEGCVLIEEQTGWRSLGIVPWFAEACKLPAEDSVGLEGRTSDFEAIDQIKIVVPMLARIANHDDLDPLAQEPDVALMFVHPGEVIPGDTDLVVLPGTKSTISDLKYLKAQGWDIDILAHVRRGGHVLGLCGGFQMLGAMVRDPNGLEGPPEETEGLGLLEVDTTLSQHKRLENVSGQHKLTSTIVNGYEMHMGQTQGAALERPFLEIDGRSEGAMSSDGQVSGTYMHGIFSGDAFRHAYLSEIKERRQSGLAYEQTVEATLDTLADHLRHCLNVEAILETARSR